LKDPDGHEPDSDPFGVLALPNKQVVTDAGANALFEVGPTGAIKTLAVFPNFDWPGVGFPVQAVPTRVVLGPDGSYYVSQLTGFPFPSGAANIYRVAAGGGTPQPVASGFTSIVDLAFAPDGSLLVLEIFTGLLKKVTASGSNVIAQFPFPGGVTVGPDGAAYVSINTSAAQGSGKVCRLPLQ